MAETMHIIKPEDQIWLSQAERNAEHRAQIFIDSGNYEKAAKALKEIPYKKALTYLYEVGRKYLHHHDVRAVTVAKVNELIEKKKFAQKEKSEHEQKYPHAKHIPIIHKKTIAEIFER